MVKRQHELDYPDYQYTPRKSSEKKRRVSKKFAIGEADIKTPIVSIDVEKPEPTTPLIVENQCMVDALDTAFSEPSCFDMAMQREPVRNGTPSSTALSAISYPMHDDFALPLLPIAFDHAHGLISTPELSQNEFYIGSSQPSEADPSSSMTHASDNNTDDFSLDDEHYDDFAAMFGKYHNHHSVNEHFDEAFHLMISTGDQAPEDISYVDPMELSKGNAFQRDAITQHDLRSGGNHPYLIQAGFEDKMQPDIVAAVDVHRQEDLFASDWQNMFADLDSV